MEEEQQEVNNEVPQEEQGGGEVAPMDDNDPTDHIPAVASLDQYIEVEKEKRKQRYIGVKSLKLTLVQGRKIWY